MESRKTIEFRRIRDFGDVLNVTFQFLRQNYLPLGKSLLLWAAPFVVAMMLFNVLIQIRFIPLDPEALAESGGYGELFLFYMGVLVFSIGGLSMACSVVYGFVGLYQRFGPDGFSLDDVWMRAKNLFFTMLGSLVAVVFVLSVVYSFLLIVLSLFVASTGGGVLTGLLILFVMLAGLAVAIFFSIVFALIFPMRALEPIGVVAAMKRSFYLIKNEWWSSFAVIFLAWLISSVLGSIFSPPPSSPPSPTRCRHRWWSRPSGC